MIPSQLLLLIGCPNDDDSSLFAEVIPGEFCHQAIVASIHQYFAENFSLAKQAIYSNETVEIDRSLNQVELLVTDFDDLIRRKNQPIMTSGQVVCHIWFRVDPSNIYGARELADEVNDLFDQGILTIRDYDATGEPVVGTLKLKEAKLEDLSDAQRDDLQLDYHHLVVTVPGTAQEQ